MTKLLSQWHQPNDDSIIVDHELSSNAMNHLEHHEVPSKKHFNGIQSFSNEKHTKYNRKKNTNKTSNTSNTMNLSNMSNAANATNTLKKSTKSSIVSNSLMTNTNERLYAKKSVVTESDMEKNSIVTEVLLDKKRNVSRKRASEQNVLPQKNHIRNRREIRLSTKEKLVQNMSIDDFMLLPSLSAVTDRIIKEELEHANVTENGIKELYEHLGQEKNREYFIGGHQKEMNSAERAAKGITHMQERMQGKKEAVKKKKKYRNEQFANDKTNSISQIFNQEKERNIKFTPKKPQFSSISNHSTPEKSKERVLTKPSTLATHQIPSPSMKKLQMPFRKDTLSQINTDNKSEYSNRSTSQRSVYSPPRWKSYPFMWNDYETMKKKSLEFNAETEFPIEQATNVESVTSITHNLEEIPSPSESNVEKDSDIDPTEIEGHEVESTDALQSFEFSEYENIENLALFTDNQLNAPTVTPKDKQNIHSLSLLSSLPTNLRQQLARNLFENQEQPITDPIYYDLLILSPQARKEYVRTLEHRQPFFDPIKYKIDREHKEKRNEKYPTRISRYAHAGKFTTGDKSIPKLIKLDPNFHEMPSNISLESGRSDRSTNLYIRKRPMSSATLLNFYLHSDSPDKCRDLMQRQHPVSDSSPVRKMKLVLDKTTPKQRIDSQKIDTSNFEELRYRSKPLEEVSRSIKSKIEAHKRVEQRSKMRALDSNF